MPSSRNARQFQSTLPARGATPPADSHTAGAADFNPRSPHGERPDDLRVTVAPQKFQSTLPARGATDAKVRKGQTPLVFQSTLPARGATRTYWYLLPSTFYFNPRSPHGERLTVFVTLAVRPRISIHAPRTGSDNPRSPHGERPARISIHAPRTGSDKTAAATRDGRGHFNPRSPHGERRYLHKKNAVAIANFNPRSPHGERRARTAQGRNGGIISIHAPRTGSDKRINSTKRPTTNFNPRSPHGERHNGT